MELCIKCNQRKRVKNGFKCYKCYRPMPLRTCQHCGTEFEPHRKTGKTSGPGIYCTFTCAMAARRKPKGHRWRICLCDVCDVLFLHKMPQARTCSEECRTEKERSRWRKRNHFRRLKENEGEQFHDLDVFKRDDWVCQLCGNKIDPDLQYPDPESKSLDHIVPISKGGEHTLANTQASHLRCNLSKGGHLISNDDYD